MNPIIGGRNTFSDDPPPEPTDEQLGGPNWCPTVLDNRRCKIPHNIHCHECRAWGRCNYGDHFLAVPLCEEHYDEIIKDLEAMEGSW